MGVLREGGVGSANSSLQPSSAPLLQMAFTGIFDNPWGWGDNQLASGMRGASGALCAPVQVLCLGGTPAPCPSGKPSREKSLSPEHSSGGRETVSVPGALGHRCAPSELPGAVGAIMFRLTFSSNVSSVTESTPAEVCVSGEAPARLRRPAVLSEEDLRR